VTHNVLHRYNDFEHYDQSTPRFGETVTEREFQRHRLGMNVRENESPGTSVSRPVILSPELRENMFLRPALKQILRFQASRRVALIYVVHKRVGSPLLLQTDTQIEGSHRRCEPQTPLNLHMGWFPSERNCSWVIKVIEIRGASLQSCTCLYGFNKSITVKYSAKEVVIQGGGQDGKGEYARPRARQEVDRASGVGLQQGHLPSREAK